ncbi:putative helicase [Port-miou virus]|uniref:Putative helicase n=1 Tax=Port-miou virus TaxID=1733873 RepID=A0A0N9PV80_9VIRU|nr:putative helicase [Port-miou virus]
MEDPTKALSLQTNDTFLSLYTFCEPKSFSGKTCLICKKTFSLDGDVKKHIRSTEHTQNFTGQNKLPHQTAKWWERFEGENDIQHFLRIDIATSIGPLPSYIKCIFAYGTVWFLSWSPSKEESMKTRTSREKQKLKGPQYYAHLFARGRSEFFVCCQLPWFGGARGFGSYSDFRTFSGIRNSVVGPQHFYEQFLEGQKVREFWDLELEEENRCWLSQDAVEMFSEARKEFCGMDSPQFYTMDSSDSKKFSCHIMVSCVHKNIFSLSKFCEKFVLWLKGEKRYSFLLRLIDGSVYRKNGSIRCFESSKFGSERVLRMLGEKPTNEELLFVTANQGELRHLWKISERGKLYRKNKPKKEEEPEPVPEQESALYGGEDHIEALIKYVKEVLDDAFDFDTDWDGQGRLDLKRIQGMQNTCPCCPEGENIHERRDAFVEIWDNLLLFGCWKTPKRKRCICKLGPQKNPKKKREAFVADFCYESPSANLIRFPEGKDCLVVKSAMGTGKTKAMIDWVVKNPKARVLFVSYRVSLVTELSRKIPGALLYTDPKAKKGGCLSAKILVCQIDSLHLVCGKFDMVVIDEALYTLDHLCEFVKNAPDCYDALGHYIKNTEKVVLLDAFMEEYVCDFVKSFGKTIWKEENTFLPHKGKTTCFLLPSKETSQEFLFSSLENKENVVFVSNSKRRVDVMSFVARDRGIKTITHTSESKATVDTKEWGKCQLLAFSPTISAGVSYEEKHFDSCHAYFTSSSAGAHSSAQMLGRVRDLSKKEMSVFVKQVRSNAPIKKEELIRRIEMREEASYRACGLVFDRTFGALLSTPFSELYVANKLRNNRSKRNFLEELRALLESQGITIVEQKNGSGDNELEQEIHEAGREVVLENFGNIESAEEISFCEYVQISESRETTPQQRFSCQKFLVSQHFRLPSQEFVTVEFLKNYGKMRTQYDSLCLTFGDEKQVRQRMKGLILGDIERRKKLPQQLLVRERYFHEKVFYIWKLLNILGFAQWWENKVVYKDKFEPLFRNVFGIVTKRHERFKSLFSSLPKSEKDTFRWFNDQLRKVFGFWFTKKKGNKGDYRCQLVFGALWDIGGTDFKVPFFVPKIGH